MTEQIVVSCRRSIGEVGSAAAAAHLERARGLAKKAEALGATLVAWGATAVTFTFEADAIEEAITLAGDLLGAAPAQNEAWACGIAQGDMAPFQPAGPGPKLAWGPPLIAAEALASIARPGEILVARDLPALRAKLLTSMGRRAGYDEGRRVRGVAVDARQPWRKDAAALVERVVEPPMFGRERVASMLTAPGTLGIVNAEPGLGGSRFMAEIAAAVAPAPVLLVAPSGALLEPLGALRHAFSRFMVTHPERIGAEVLPLLDRLLTGVGVDAKSACALLLTALGTGKGERPGALLLDDAHEIDEESVDICARAAKAAGDSLHLAIRSDGTWDLPPVLTRLPRGTEITLSPFGRRDGEAFAAACLGNGLSEAAQERWSRRGGFAPLGILEAIAAGFVTGDLAWLEEQASPRRRFAGKGRPRDATEWIRDRAGFLDEPKRALVSAVALLGGRAPTTMLAALLAEVGVACDVRAARSALVAQRWIRKTDDAHLALPSSTHARALLSLLDQETALRWHAAAADVIAREPGVLALADAAYHASKARDGARAAELARAAAEIAMAARLDDGAARLLEFSKSLGRDGGSAPKGLSMAPPMDDDAAPTQELRLSGAFRAAAAAELADDGDPFPADEKTLDGDPAGVNDPRNVPEDAPDDTLAMKRDPALADALDRADSSKNGPHKRDGQEDLPSARPPGPVVLGKIPEILRLRAAKSAAESGSLAARCQSSLALGVALASVGRVEEALLEGLDALARAREEENERGLEACLAFLTKLFARVSRPEEARRLSMAARRPVDERLRPPY